MIEISELTTNIYLTWFLGQVLGASAISVMRKFVLRALGNSCLIAGGDCPLSPLTGSLPFTDDNDDDDVTPFIRSVI